MFMATLRFCLRLEEGYTFDRCGQYEFVKTKELCADNRIYSAIKKDAICREMGGIGKH